jgi:acylphosphatase
MALERLEIHFSGRVQGVGFRYTTKRLAADFDVTGIVKNLPNGQVELIAEGATAEIDGFLEAIQSEMRGNIRDLQVDRADYQGAFATFDITY